MTELAEINEKLDAIIKYLGIEGQVRRSKRSIDDEMAARVFELQNRRKKRNGGNGRETNRTR